MNLLGNRFIHAIFCEEVRAEVKGGSTYVGVFKSSIVLSKPPPFRIRSFAAVIWIVTSYDDIIGEMNFSLTVSGKKDSNSRKLIPPVIQANLKKNKEKTDRRLGIVSIDYGPLIIEETGSVLLSVTSEDESAILAKINIRLKEERDVKKLSQEKRKKNL